MTQPNAETQQRILRLAQEGMELMRDNLIWQQNGRYHVFGHYEITATARGCRVQPQHQDARQFGTVKTGLAWCIAHKYQRHDVAMAIATLDQQQQIAAADVQVRTQQARRTKDAQRRETSLLKADCRQQQLSQIQHQLDKCVNLAKYWQIRGFNNETARTGRSPSQRTSRPGI